MTALLDRRLDQLRRRRRGQRAVAWLLPALALSGCIGACLIVMLRLAAPGLGWLAWPLAAAAALAPLALLPRACRRRDQRAVIAGHLDRLIGAQGVVMALAAQPAAQRDEGWSERVRIPLEDLRWPPLRWPRWGLALLALLATAGAALLPQREAPLAVGAAWQALMAGTGDRVRDLGEAGLLPNEEQRELERQLERLRQSASETGMTEAVWAGLDRVERAAGDHARRAAQRLGEALSQAERSAGTPPDLATAEAELQQLARQLAELQQLAPGLAPQLPQLPPGSAEALRQALQHAGAGAALTPQQLRALQELGLDPSGLPAEGYDPERYREAALALTRQLEDHAQRLERFGLGAALAFGQRSGRGGLGRGPGHAQLELSNQGDEQAGALDHLPPGARLNPDGSVTLAETRREADLDPAALEQLQRAARRHFDPAAADARRAAVAPRHRQAVASYFGGDASEETP